MSTPMTEEQLNGFAKWNSDNPIVLDLIKEVRRLRSMLMLPDKDTFDLADGSHYRRVECMEPVCSDLRSQLAAEREAHEKTRAELQKWETGQKLFMGDDFGDSIPEVVEALRKELEAEKEAHRETKAELSSTKEKMRKDEISRTYIVGGRRLFRQLFRDQKNRAEKAETQLAAEREAHCRCRELRDAHGKTITQLQGRLDGERAEHEKKQADFKQFLQDISEDMECLPTCDSTMHDDNCPFAFPAVAWRNLREELAAVIAERDELRKWIENAPKIHVKRVDGRSAGSGYFDGILYHFLDCNPLNLKPGQSVKVRLVVEKE